MPDHQTDTTGSSSPRLMRSQYAADPTVHSVRTGVTSIRERAIEVGRRSSIAIRRIVGRHSEPPTDVVAAQLREGEAGEMKGKRRKTRRWEPSRRIEEAKEALHVARTTKSLSKRAKKHVACANV